MIIKISKHWFFDPNRVFEHPVRTALSLAGIDRRYGKIFCIGFNKTATTSITATLRNAGLSSHHGVKWQRPRLQRVHFLNKTFSDGNPHDFSWLDKRFPNSRFILNIRDLTEWMDSRIQHNNFLHQRGHPKHPTHGVEDQSVMRWVRTRNTHHLDVMQYFANRPENLLIINYIRNSDAADIIAGFAGMRAKGEKPYSRPIPKTRYQGQLVNGEQIQRCLTALGIPKSEWSNDLYCPSLETDPELLKFPADSSMIRK